MFDKFYKTDIIAKIKKKYRRILTGYPPALLTRGLQILTFLFH